MGLFRILIVLLAVVLASVMSVATYKLVTGTMFETGQRLGFILMGWLSAAGLVAWLWTRTRRQSRRD